MTVLKSIIEELVESRIDEVLRSFDLQKFKQLAATNVRPTNKEEEEEFVWGRKTHPEIAYARQNLPELGEGSSRLTFAVSGGKVLKIAKNKQGLAQNKVEVDVFTSSKENSIVTKIFDFSPDYKWLISEIVRPVKPKEFEGITGISANHWGNLMVFHSMEDLKINATELANKIEMNRYSTGVFRKWDEERLQTFNLVLSDPKIMKFVQDIWDFADKHDLHKGDIHNDHFGITANRELRIFDYGLTWDVFRTEYGR